MTLAPPDRLAAARCSSCPKMCRGVCPTLEVTRNERHQPWGHAREALAADRSAEAGGAGFAAGPAAESTYLCATCGACTVPCEVEGVETPLLTWAVRAAVWEAGGAPAVARRAVTEAAAGRVLSAELPPVWSDPQPTLEALRELAGPGATLLLLPGCGTLGRRPEAVLAAGRALRALEVPFAVPDRHRCCGAVARAMGDASGASRAAAETAAAARAQGCERVAVQSPSCAHHLAADPAVAAAVEVLPLPSLLASTLEAAGGGGPASGAGTGTEVTYHDPCFLARHLDATEAARTALRESGHRVAELPSRGRWTRCCGRGGGLALTHPEVAAGYLDHLAAEVRSSGARSLVTGCGTCAAALAGVLDGVAVAELAEAVAAAVAAERPA